MEEKGYTEVGQGGGGGGLEKEEVSRISCGIEGGKENLLLERGITSFRKKKSRPVHC